MAEEVRFELTVPLRVRRFSRVIRLINCDSLPFAATIRPSFFANLPCGSDLSKVVRICREVSHNCPIRDISGQPVRMPNMRLECRNCAGRIYRFRLCEYRRSAYFIAQKLGVTRWFHGIRAMSSARPQKPVAPAMVRPTPIRPVSRKNAGVRK